MGKIEWLKILCFAFLTALFFVILYRLFIPQVGRYHKINLVSDRRDTWELRTFYIDTATGKIYSVNGEIFSEPTNKRRK